MNDAQDCTATSGSLGAWGNAILFGAVTTAFIALETWNHGHHRPIHFSLTFTRGLIDRTWTGWQLLYLAGYALYFVPVSLAGFRAHPSAMLRTLVGFAAQLIIGVLVPEGWLPCLQVANLTFIAYVVGRFGPSLWRDALLTGAVVLAINATIIGQHAPAAVALGLALGWLTYRISFSRALQFLDEADPWTVVLFDVRELAAMWIGNHRSYWEEAYKAGCWEFLDSLDQRPRHYVIAGIIHDHFYWDADILDVGCGHGVLYPLLGTSIATYTGIDLADEAIASCRSAFSGDSRCAFERTAFEDYRPAQRFDVVVLNEILYYLPLHSVDDVLERCLQLLKNDNSVLVVSLCRNFKARLVTRRLARLARPEQRIRVHNSLTGSYWTVSVYRRGLVNAARFPIPEVAAGSDPFSDLARDGP